MTRLGLVWDPVFLEHITDEGHPEHPRRLRILYDLLKNATLSRHIATIAPRRATDHEILGVHSPAYLKKVKGTAAFPSSTLSADTLACDRTYDVASMAAGGTISAIEQVLARRVSHALVLARPPGHHAERSRAMGYCIFNNVAIGAVTARKEMGVERVMVIDWDLHHGNGTQHIFDRDPSVFFFSSHQFPHYPGTGHLTETGMGPGEGTTLNVPLGKGWTDGDFIALYRRLLPPVTHGFAPQLILVSAGFDLHTGDPLGGMKVTPAGFAGLTRLIVDLAGEACEGRVVFCLEGGYDPGALVESVFAMIHELTGQTRCDLDALAATADLAKVDQLITRCAHIHGRFWKGMQRRGR